MSTISALLSSLRGLWRRPIPAAPVDSLEGLPVGRLDESLVMRAALGSLLADRRAERRSRTLRAFLYFLMFALPAILYVGFYAWSAGFRLGPTGKVVAVVRLEGEMVEGSPASAERVIPALRKAFELDSAQAVVLAIDSPGGSPLEAERIYTALQGLRKSKPKPVVAVINNLGASAAYLVAIHADHIYAGRYSLVGSVGAILSGWDAHEALGRQGVSQRVYTSGELKSLMNPYVAMSPQAERKANELVGAVARTFQAEVAARRAGKLAAGTDIGTGEVWGGPDAVRLGLIDELSTFEQVMQDRWPGLQTHDLGPRATGLPFATAASQWLGQLLRTVAASAAGSAQPALALR